MSTTNLLVIALLLGLAGCDGASTAQGYAEYNIHEITLKDGRPCLVLRSGYRGGLSCDWNYQPEVDGGGE